MVTAGQSRSQVKDSSEARPDSELLASVRNGDSTAFREIVDRYGDGLYRYCRFMLDEHEAAQDIVQEAFVTLLRVSRSDTEVRRVKSYLVTVARRRCLNYIRDRKPTVDYNSSEMPTNRIDLEMIDMRDGLRLALRQLPEHYREAFLLYELEGYSYEEVAEAVESSYGAVKNRIYRAKLELRRILDPLLRDHLK